MAEGVSDSCCTERRAACNKLIDLKIRSQNELFETKAAAIDKALTLAEKKLTDKLETLNEYKETTKDFVTKEQHQFVVDDIKRLQINEATLAGKASQQDLNKVALATSDAGTRGWIAIVVAILTALLTFVWHFWAK